MDYKILFLLGIIITILSSNYITNNIGDRFYKGKNIELFDIFHQILPDLYSYGNITNTIPSIFVGLYILLFLPSTLQIEFLAKFIIILFILSFAIISTILPGHNDCEVNPNILTTFIGDCYDKVFSGHTAMVLLLCLILYREHIISITNLISINLINILLILATRSHYTIDIIVSIFITSTIFNIKL